MINKTFLSFLFLLVYQHRIKHIAIFIISTILIITLVSVMFISTSIKHQLLGFVDSQSDFVVQKVRAGNRDDIPNEWIDDFRKIRGISHIQPRIYGEYYHLASDYKFTIIGIDLFEEYTSSQIKKVFDDIDIEKFMSDDYMIIGSGVKNFFDKNYYKEYYNFLTPELDIQRVMIFDTMPKNSDIISNDLILMDIDLAKKILGIDKDKSTDIVLNVPNDTEWINLKVELIDKHHNIKIITKEDLQKSYMNLYNYKSGFFLIVFMILLLTFCLILYQRYSMINSSDKKEIAIFRATGWSIKAIIVLKVFESAIVGIFSFLIGVIIAYIFVFVLDAPLLADIFLGSHNIGHNVSFAPYIEFSMLFSLFMFFMIFFIASVLIPAWKIATSDIDGSLR